MAGVKELMLVPVRGTIYVVRLPFALVWMILSSVFALLCTIVSKIISIPVNYVKRAARRIQVTWNWTKNSAKSLLPWKSNSNSARGTQTGYPAIEGHELEDDQFYDSLVSPPRHGHGKRYRRKAIISSLIRLLADPGSPPESEEETETYDEDDRVYKLIRDLIQFSKSGLHSQVPRTPHAQVLDMEILRQHARDKDKLQTLILELDQYVKDMDSEPQQQQQQYRAGGVSHRSGGRDIARRDSTVSSNADTDPYIDASEGEPDYQTDDGEEFDDARATLPPDSPPPVCGRGLSPVAEVSPEVASVSSMESLENHKDIEADLNTALSHLSTLTNELNEVESILESRQTKITETVIIATMPEKTDERNDSSFEDAPDDFLSIPKTSPTLGLEAGHSRRNLGTARNIRPPSLPKRNQQLPVEDPAAQTPFSKESSVEFEDDGSEWSSDEEDASSRSGESSEQSEKLTGAGALSLSDQFQLLTPPTSSHGHLEQASDTYSTVNKKAKPVRTRAKSEETSRNREPDPHRNRSVSDGNPVEEVEKSTTLPERSLFMHDLTPPWKQMRSHNSSSSIGSSTGSPVTTPSHASAQPSHITQHITPPPPPPPSRKSLTPPTTQSSKLLPQLVASMSDTSAVPLPQQSSAANLESKQDHHVLESPGLYDKLPRVLLAPPIPSKAGEEGVYDIIPGQRHRYLHEKMAVGEKRRESFPPIPPTSWTPQLPPRNSTNRLKRTSSDEVMGTLLRDCDGQVLVRHGSERRPSVSSAQDFRERSQSSPSSSKKPRTSSTESGRIRRDRASSERRHHRSGELSVSNKHRGSSEKRRSSDKKSASSSSKTKPPEIPSVWKILTGPSPSKKTSSPSSSKKEREKKKVKDGKHSSSSSRTKETKSGARTDSSSSKPKMHTTSQKKDESSAMPRNESSSSLKSGVSTLSTDSSGKDSLV